MDQGMGGFAFTPLFDISPISELQNSSSDCWPVLPKSHNLAMIGMDTALGNYTLEGNLAEVYKITPVLTVFFSKRDGGLVDGTSAQLTCLNVITEDSKDAPSMSSRNLLRVGVALLAALLFNTFF
ncbi:hypothetical protein MPDQ_000432 [Monascus purpureus]|uniref:Uncharacterized protein n=1 Tax=Monascus purpureus TaxID=5098 RepID=A0A507QTU6_MONPU|nr:hypothetical protein MPDQ_000432 [Monascus purpureus]BDD60335.1 hypothetical protein MAP00_005473 [Monascus purpureus]